MPKPSLSPAENPPGPPPSGTDFVTVRVGCHFDYVAPADTVMLLDVQPQPENGQVVTAERLTFDREVNPSPMINNHGNQVLRLTLPPGRTSIVHDALVQTSLLPDCAGAEFAAALTPADLPAGVLRYTMPSRHCESEKLSDFAWRTFGDLPAGWARVAAISDWVHSNVEYRFGSGSPDLSAFEVFERRYGVCRDFAHLTIAFCRALNIPARYVTGHLPDIGYEDPGTPMDFHAYAEVYLGDRWFAADARYNCPRIGRIKISHGLDAVDCAFGTTFGAVDLNYFEVWAYQIEPGTVALGDPIDLTRRLDGTPAIRLRHPRSERSADRLNVLG